MKFKLAIIPILFVSSTLLQAEKLDLTCDAALFSIESDRGALLKPGFIRVVSPAISAFVASDGYSTSTRISCEKDEETGIDQCLGLNNTEFCKDPKDTFRIRSVKDDNSTIMVGNRCTGSYKKYVSQWQDIEEAERLEVFTSDLFRMKYYEDRMAFRMKNKIFQQVGTNSDSQYDRHQPVLTLEEEEPATSGKYHLKISPISTINMHEQYILKTSCSVR